MAENVRNACKQEKSCRSVDERREIAPKFRRGRKVHDVPKRSTLPPAYYAKGFSILPVYKRQFDYTEMRKLFFLEDPDPKMVAKWGQLRSRIPLPETRVVNLPGTRDLYHKSLKKMFPEGTSLERIEKLLAERENPKDERIIECICDNPQCRLKQMQCKK